MSAPRESEGAAAARYWICTNCNVWVATAAARCFWCHQPTPPSAPSAVAGTVRDV